MYCSRDSVLGIQHIQRSNHKRRILRSLKFRNRGYHRTQLLKHILLTKQSKLGLYMWPVASAKARLEGGCLDNSSTACMNTCTRKWLLITERKVFERLRSHVQLQHVDFGASWTSSKRFYSMTRHMTGTGNTFIEYSTIELLLTIKARTELCMLSTLTRVPVNVPNRRMDPHSPGEYSSEPWLVHRLNTNTYLHP